MKTQILAGLVTAVVFGGTAMAGEGKDVKPKQGDVTESPSNLGLQDSVQDDMALQQEPGIGGSGEMAPAPAVKPPPPHAKGALVPSGMSLYCTPIEQGTGGAGLSHPVPPPPPPEHSALEREFDAHDHAIGGSGLDIREREVKEVRIEDKGTRHKKDADMRGLTVLLGAGVEGYTGGLAPEVRPGAAVGVTAAIKPTRVFGLELAYSGAANNLREDAGGSGPDIIRNGGQAALTFGLSSTAVQPYVLGGFGLNRYNVRNGEALGFRDDTNANVPVGAGLRTHIGDFTADARLNYNFLLNNDFATGVASDTWTGRYTGTVNIGGTF